MGRTSSAQGEFIVPPPHVRVNKHGASGACQDLDDFSEEASYGPTLLPAVTQQHSPQRQHSLCTRLSPAYARSLQPCLYQLLAGVEVIATSADRDEVLDLAGQFNPAVALVDGRTAGLDGMGVT